VHTQTAIYLINLDQCAVTRYPDASNPLRPNDLRDDGEDYAVSKLRSDTEPVPLVQLRILAVGEPMILVLGIRDDGVLTIRPTTPVRAIVRATDLGGGHAECEGRPGCKP
jgi:hypothetical protein